MTSVNLSWYICGREWRQDISGPVPRDRERPGFGPALAARPVAEDRKAIGDDIRSAEFGWPVGMPLCRPMAGRRGLWEIRTTLAGNRIARVLFCAHDGNLVLLHGFIKKTRRAPKRELDLAVRRKRGLR